MSDLGSFKERLKANPSHFYLAQHLCAASACRLADPKIPPECEGSRRYYAFHARAAWEKYLRLNPGMRG